MDSLQVLKGSTLTEDEYQKAAILGWCVELVCFTSLYIPFLSDDRLVASVLPRFRRCHGLFHHPPGPAVLV